jgi:hypothetical protein
MTAQWKSIESYRVLAEQLEVLGQSSSGFSPLGNGPQPHFDEREINLEGGFNPAPIRFHAYRCIRRATACTRYPNQHVGAMWHGSWPTMTQTDTYQHVLLLTFFPLSFSHVNNISVV